MSLGSPASSVAVRDEPELSTREREDGCGLARAVERIVVEKCIVASAEPWIVDEWRQGGHR